MPHVPRRIYPRSVPNMCHVPCRICPTSRAEYTPPYLVHTKIVLDNHQFYELGVPPPSSRPFRPILSRPFRIRIWHAGSPDVTFTCLWSKDPGTAPNPYISPYSSEQPDETNTTIEYIQKISRNYSIRAHTQQNAKHNKTHNTTKRATSTYAGTGLFAILKSRRAQHDKTKILTDKVMQRVTCPISASF